MIYERCLEERNATLASLSINPLEFTTLPPEGSIIAIGNNETHTMPALPECDLEKELDNVSVFVVRNTNNIRFCKSKINALCMVKVV